MRPQGFQHQLGAGHVPVFAGVVERLLFGPQPQNDVERLAGHLAVLAGVAVDVEHRPVARQPARGDAEIEPALRQMVEHRDPVGELGRVVIGQQETARREADPARLHQRLGDQEIGRRVRLPRRGVVLADPGFGKAQLVGPAQRLQIPAMALIKAALGRVRGHREQAVLHRAMPPLGVSPTLGEVRRIFSRNRMVAKRQSNALCVPALRRPRRIVAALRGATSRQFVGRKQ